MRKFNTKGISKPDALLLSIAIHSFLFEDKSGNEQITDKGLERMIEIYHSINVKLMPEIFFSKETFNDYRDGIIKEYRERYTFSSE